MTKITFATLIRKVTLSIRFQEDKKKRSLKKWDALKPGSNSTKTAFTNTNEGTWMNLDVSPDVKPLYLAFGDIYPCPHNKYTGAFPWYTESHLTYLAAVVI
jgi:hypothetical protein